MSEQKDDHPFYAAVNAKLANIAAACSPRPVWYESWARLGPQSSKQERLAVYRAVRAAGSVPAEAGFFLVAWAFDLLTEDRAAEGLREVEQCLEEVRRKYGLDTDASAEADDMPAEYRQAMQRCHDVWEALYASILEEFGEHDLAQLFRDNPEEFERQYESGRQFFHGPGGDDESDDAVWLDLLQNSVSSCIEADSAMGPLGLRYREEEGFWEVWIYPTPVEVVGGADDGEVLMPGFWLDLEQFRQEFDAVVAFGWNSLGLSWPEGPHVSIEAVFRGREVYLQVLACAPEDEEPGLKLDATRRRRQSE
jgi:hypothetical protein